MSSFSVNNINGVYQYNRHEVWTYLGMIPANSRKLEKTFKEFNVRPTGDEQHDLRKLDSKMYERYSEQVQSQIENQNNQQNVPWASLCQKIGVKVTGDYATDLEAFNNAMHLLSQSAVDGQAMTFFATLKSEAATAFGLSNKPTDALSAMSFQNYQAQFLL